MPFVNVRTTRGLLNEAKKAQLHNELTDLLVRIEGGGDPTFRQYVLVLVEEHDAASWSVAGQQLTDEAVRELQGNSNLPAVLKLTNGERS